MNTKAAIAETHEPEEPTNWPHGHVGVTRANAMGNKSDWLTMDNVGVELTDDTAGECIAITLADTRHFLHSTTARELSNMLLGLNGPPVTITIHDVNHSAGGAAARTLSKALNARLKEWNRTAAANGVMTV
jgi:hypothetical protein